jgi:16S rRNA (cytosine967-C5)-methyltransferase
MTSGPAASTQLRSRQVAFDVLREVDERDAYANLVLPNRMRSAGLDVRDAAFATELTYGTLRRLGTYDAIVRRCSTRDRVDPPVGDLLRLGAHQLFAMKVPSHAAVATTVELAKRNGMRGATGFVNAVLRRMSSTPLAQWLDELTEGLPSGSDADLAVRESHPPWLVARLRRALEVSGRPGAEVAELLAADNVPAPLTLVARPPRSTVAELVGAGATPGRWSPFAAVLDGGDPGLVQAVRERRAGVQDEGSQLMAIALAEATVEAGPDNRWLDMCAGPGGKAALLAAIGARRDARLEAWELHEHRAQLVRSQVPSDTPVHVRDAGDPSVVAQHAGRFDRVLLDAPCTGAGALRRRPEARWRKSEADLPALVTAQTRLLAGALELVRPGGLVAYVTCTPLVDETRGVLDAVCGPDVDVLDARAALTSVVADLGSGPYVQLWPHRHGTDAMFLALLRRR